MINKTISSRNKTILLLMVLFFAMACKKESKTNSSQSAEFVKDIDGNSYNTVKIGNQTWLKENLKVTRYRDGSPLVKGKKNDEWRNSKEGGYVSYDDDSTNIPRYGLLYNWYAVVDPKSLCPTGWHTPSKEEWDELINFAGGADVAGMNLESKQWDTTFYLGEYPIDKFGFSAMPAGSLRADGMIYQGIGGNAFFWTSTVSPSPDPYDEPYLVAFSKYHRVNYLEFWSKATGASVRCIKD